MSIEGLINSWVQDGRLVALEPALPSEPNVRSVFASAEVRSALMGPWATTRIEVRLSSARADVDAFISGSPFGVRMPPSRSVKARLALLDDPSHEVWEIRTRDPKPGVRIFGRFAEGDCFVALTWAFREEVNNDDWTREIERCKREWRTLFPTYNPLSGGDVDAYVTNAFPV